MWRGPWSYGGGGRGLGTRRCVAPLRARSVAGGRHRQKAPRNQRRKYSTARAARPGLCWLISAQRSARRGNCAGGEPRSTTIRQRHAARHGGQRREMASGRQGPAAPGSVSKPAIRSGAAWANWCQVPPAPPAPHGAGRAAASTPAAPGHARPGHARPAAWACHSCQTDQVRHQHALAGFDKAASR